MGDPTPTFATGEPADNPGSPPTTQPARWVDEHGDILFRFALVRVRHPAQAEDLVQDTFLAALKARERFEGKSSERTWLIGILKNKLLDHFRKAGRETSLTDLDFSSGEEEAAFIQEGLSQGKWQRESGPRSWGDDPAQSLDQQAFWEAFRHCLSGLPARVAEAFLLREMDGVETEDICRSLQISPNHYWVMLHRARLALRRCLEANWFAKE